MAEITVLNKGTVSRTLAAVLGVALSGAAVYGAVRGMSAWYRQHQFSENAAEVEKALKSNDVTLAKRLLSSLKKGHLALDDVVKLELTLERKLLKQRIERKFHENLNAYNLDGANKVIADAERSGVYRQPEIQELERRVYNSTEQGLFVSIQEKRGNEKVDLAREYLNHYPQGAHRKRAIEELLIGGFSAFTDSLREGEPVGKVYSWITYLEVRLQQFSGEGVTLPFLQKYGETLTALVQGYIGKDLPGDGKITLNDTVRVTGSSIDFAWNGDYRAERDGTFPIGSEGKVIAVIKETIYVKFPEQKSYAWKTDWANPGPADLWEGNKKNVALYKASELTGKRLLDEIEVSQLRTRIETLKEKLKPYL